MEVIATRRANNELYHHGVKGMKWGVRRYQNKDGTYTNTGRARRREDKADSSLTGISKIEQKRNYKTVTRYAKAVKKARTIGERMKADNDLENSFREQAKTCKESIDRQWSTMSRMREYEKPYLDEWKRLNDNYLSKHKTVYSEDNIPAKDRQNIKRQAAKNVGYDEKEYNRLKSDFETARDNAERECRKVADHLLGKYGNNPVLHEGYTNEQTARDLVGETLKSLNLQDHRK